MEETYYLPYREIRESDETIEIRGLRQEDYECFRRGYAGQKPSRTRFDEGRMDIGFMDEEWFAALIQRRKAWADDDVSYMLNIFRIADATMLGFCDITTHMREAFQYARIGYTVFNQYWNCGYGKQTAALLLQLGFGKLGFHRLEAYIDHENTRSMRVALACGMRYECKREAFELQNDVWQDRDVYVIRKECWKAGT
jgi:RimJ/RimL family protein N-acetyltransferase